MKFDYYITGTIGEQYDWWTGNRGTTANMVKNFLNEHKDQEVTIAVSSLGGYIDDGLTIMEYIKEHGKCNMVIIGMTASAATILCMKAKSVKIARGSMMLIHNSSQMLDVWTSANKEKIDEIIKAFQHEREQLDTIDKCLADIYSIKNGKTLEENMEMMGKEKWLSAKDALEFGLVDSIIDDDEVLTEKAKSVKNSYAANKDAAEHYAVPSFEGEKTSLIQRFVKKISGKDEPIIQPHNSLNSNTTAMKKIILNLFCALLSIQDIELNTENGTANLTEDQLKTIENGLKEKDDRIADLQNQLQTANSAKTAAETAKATAEKQLNDLQTEFDEFKAQAGEKSPAHPTGEHSAQDTEPKNAKEMYNSIKTLL